VFVAWRRLAKRVREGDAAMQVTRPMVVQHVQAGREVTEAKLAEGWPLARRARRVREHKVDHLALGAQHA
jgi:hypothetical protein